MNRNRTLLALAAGLALCTGASAQVVITHAKALAGNVTPGDAPGYPVTISTPGSFKLGSNLNVPMGSHGIELTASSVSIDLNGYGIRGSGTCEWLNYVVSCSNVGENSYGVFGYTGVDDLHIRNGFVRGFGTGITAVSGTISDTTASHNKWGGIFASGDGAIVVSRVVASLNGGDGVRCDQCTIVHSTAHKNGGHGFTSFVRPLDRMHVIGSTATMNGQQGIYKTVVRDSVITDNGQSTYRPDVLSAGGNVDDAGIF